MAPAVPGSELDRHLVELCSPASIPLLAHLDFNSLLGRAAALDVFPLAFHRLRHSPGGDPARVSPEWEERFRANAARNLFLDAEQRQLLTALAAAGVRALLLKGTWLAQRLYGDPALRSQMDVDLYVPPRQLGIAFEVLASRGYRRLRAACLAPERLALTGDEFTSECSLLGSGGMPVLLELHWRILPMPASEFEAALTGACGQLPHELEFLHLCVEAAKDRWGSLKALVDLAHWVSGQPMEWERVLGVAGHLGVGRILDITLAVLRNHFDLPGLEPLRACRESAPSPAARPEIVANPFAPPQPLSPAAWHRLRLVLRERLRDRLGYAFYLLRPTPSDLAAVDLPSRLGFLYWGVRWLRLAGRLDARRHAAVAVAE